MDLLVQGLSPGSFTKWGSGAMYGTERHFRVGCSRCMHMGHSKTGDLDRPIRYRRVNHSEALISSSALSRLS